MSAQIELYYSLGEKEREIVRAAAKAGDSPMTRQMLKLYFPKLAPEETTKLLVHLRGNVVMTEQQPRRETDPLTGIVTCEEWRKDGKRHRADGPAYIERDAVTGTVTHEEWWTGGKLDRTDGPAFTLRDDQTGTVIREEWYKDGHQIEPPSDGARS